VTNDLKWTTAVLARDLRGLKRELEAYAKESDLWRVLPGLPNPGGNLALHLTGNIQHFIGTVLGKTGYVRDRDAEFKSRDVPREKLMVEVGEAIKVVEAVLPGLSQSDIDRDYPLPIAGHRVKTGDFLLHLVAHFTYHLGQLDYHRRAVTGNAAGVGAVAVTELASATKV
jgi:uncharacterized protein DUF1572